MSKFVVIVVGSVPRYFDTPEAALEHAALRVFITQSHLPYLRDQLKSGQLVKWSYAWNAVSIYPPGVDVDEGV